MQDLKYIRETDFSKGYNDKTKPELLPEGYCADALNCFLDDQLITKRTGYTEKGTDVEISKPILDMKAVEFSTGTKFIIRARDTANGANSIIEAWTGTGAWGALTGASSQTASKPHVFVTANDICYLMNDTDTVLKTTNGTSTSTVAAFPKGVDAKWFHNCMFVITATGRLYFSNLNDPETWGADNYIDINPKDGDITVGLGVLKDELDIFKQNRVWALTGFGLSDYTVADMGERVTGLGAQSRKSIVETGDDVYFLAKVGEVPHFRSIMRTRYGTIVAGEIISDAIEGTMKSLIMSQLDNCAGIFDGRKIWWSVTNTGSTNSLVLVYDTLTKGWTRHTGINASCWTLSTLSGYPEVYFGEAGSSAKTYKMDSSKSDAGTAIDMQFKTRLYSPFPERKCKWKYLQLACDVASPGTLDVDYSVDGFDLSDLASLTLTGIGSTLPLTLDTSRLGTPSIARERIDSAGGVSYKVQYRFRNNTATDAIRIREYQLMYKPKGLRAVSEM